MQCVILTLLILQSNPKLYFTKASRTISDDINIPFDQPCGLGKIAKLINAGKIDSSELITMKTLKVLTIFFFLKKKICSALFVVLNFFFLLCQDTGAIGKQIKDGIRLMGRGAEEIKWPIHLEASIRFR